MSAEARPFDLHVRGLHFDALAWGPPAQQAPTILLLHGFPQRAASWDAVAGRLARAGRACVAPDQRGYSPGARPGNYARAELVADVVAFVEALGGPVDLVGHDWGGVVGWDVAARHPGALRSWTAVSTPAQRAVDALLASGSADGAGSEEGARSADGDAQRRQFAYIKRFRAPDAAERLLADDAAGLRALYAGGQLPPGRVEADVSAMSAPGALDAALGWYRAMSPTDGAGVPLVQVPTSYVWGSEDISFGRAAAERTADAVSGPYRFVPLQGASHWLPDERPDDVARVILDQVGG